jgi:hypothetical protein
VNFATANGSAVSGSDYTATSGTLTFSPGQTSKTVTLTVIGDLVNEGDETFSVNLTSPVGGAITRAQGLVLIRDDDANTAPVNGSLSPSSATDAPNAQRVFTANYSDANGTGDFSSVMLNINRSASTMGALACQYNPVSNKLYVRNETNTGWLGGFLPGSNNIISNGQGSLHCAQTAVSKSGNTITVKWAVSASGTWAGTTQRTYLFSRDRAGAQDGYDLKGSWAINGNIAPVNTSLTPNAIQSVIAEEKSVVSVHSDSNGSGNISQAILRIGGGTANGFRVFYNPVKNKLYLLNDAGTGYLGGIVAGSPGIITNSRGSLNCALTTVTRGANTISVNWRISLKNSSWTGTRQNVSLFTRDRADAVDGVENFGTWTLSALSTRTARSSSTLSTVSASPETGTVTLIFSGALNTDEAQYPQNYAVSVNGVATAVESASVSGSQVNLRLSGALRAGDDVEVTWRNLPGSGSVAVTAR